MTIPVAQPIFVAVFWGRGPAAAADPIRSPADWRARPGLPARIDGVSVCPTPPARAGRLPGADHPSVAERQAGGRAGRRRRHGTAR
jgi:hypothetical protein